jgi:HK97 family phage prohead protease
MVSRPHDRYLAYLALRMDSRAGSHDPAVADQDELRTLVCTVARRARAEGDEDAPAILEGYAAVFNEIVTIGRWFREQIAPGAFAKAVKEDDVRALFNHNPDLVLGRTAAKTLALAEDTTGLRATITTPDTTVGRDVVTLVERGDISGMSFAFLVRKDTWEESDDPDSLELPLRTIQDVKLFDVAPVTYPAYPQTSIAARNRARAYLDRSVLAAQARERELLFAEADL